MSAFSRFSRSISRACSRMRRAISSRDGSASHHPAATATYKHGTRKRSSDPARHFRPRALTKDKKRCGPRENDNRRRRERTDRTTAPVPYLGAARADAGPPVSLQLEPALGHRGHHVVEFLLPAVPGPDQRAAGRRIPHAPAAPSARQAPCHLRRAPRAPQSRRPGVRSCPARPDHAGGVARLRARAQSGGVHLGLLEAPRTPEPVSEIVRRTQLPCPRSTPSHAPSPDARRRLLAAGGIVRVVTILCDPQ